MVPYDKVHCLHIEASSHCNAACPVCPRNYHGGTTYDWFEKKHLTLAEHQKFFPLDFASRLNQVLYCGNLGDPTLNPELVEICQWWLSCNPAMTIHINTNAGTQDAEFWARLGQTLKGTPGNVTFSVDGLADTNHLYRRNVQWEKVQTAMKAYLNAGGPAVWEYLVFRHNQHQVEEARALAMDMGFQQFHPKKAMGFSGLGEATAIPVLKRDGSLDYHLFPPDEEQFRNRGADMNDDPVRLVIPHARAQATLKEDEDLANFTLNVGLEKKFNDSGIECMAINSAQLYVSSEGLVYPCCFIGSRQYAPNRWNFINKQIQQFLESAGKSRYSLHQRTLKEILGDTWFRDGFKETWDKPSVRDGKLAVCAEFCGTGHTEMKEATAHRHKYSPERKMKFAKDPKQNPLFCLAPWTHTFISPQSERRLCCASREMPSFIQQYIDQNGGDMSEKAYAPVDLETHWNSDYMKDIRLKMMNGEAVPACEICQSQRLHIHTYKDYFTKNLFSHLLDKVEEHTGEDGSTDWRPRSFDYRFSNLCNFKCRMCGEQLSSAWEQEKRQAGMWRPEDQPWMIPQIRDHIAKFTEDVVEKEFDAAIERGDMEEIYWVGGEPTIWPKQWETMEKLIQKGGARNVHVRYNTNLALVSWKDRHLFHDILPNFKSYQVCASIDAAGKIGEWIRTGLNWKKWKDNFSSGLQYIPQRGPHSLTMDLTLTLPGLFGLEDLLKHARAMDVQMYVKIVYAFDPSVVLSPLALPREILHPILDRLIERLTPMCDSKTIVLIQTLQELKTRQTFREEYPNWREGFQNGKNFMQDLARLRGDGTRGRIKLEDILSADPAALRWWEGQYP